MGLIKEMQKTTIIKNNKEDAILEHIASGKHYLVHEIIPVNSSDVEKIINLFYDNGYLLKTVSTAGLDTKSLNRSPITLIFEKIWKF